MRKLSVCLALLLASSTAHADDVEVRRWRFVDLPSRGWHGGKFRKKPATTIGELLIDLKTGRCVYRWWHSIYYRDKAVGTPTRKRPLLSGAVGFDGKRYWIAGFYRGNLPSWQAERVTLLPAPGKPGTTVRPMREGDAHGGSWGPGGWQARVVHPWYAGAPLHSLMRQLGSSGWDVAATTKAMKSSKYTKPGKPTARYFTSRYNDGEHGTLFVYEPKKTAGQDPRIPPHWAKREGGDWKYLVELAEDGPAPRSGHIVHAAGMWTGPWPYFSPMQYDFYRDDKSKTVDDAVFGHAYYSDDKTTVRHPKR